MGEATLTIDGLQVPASEGMTVMDAALQSGIYIPGLCHHPDLKPVGACRLCMVEIEGRGLVASCLAPAEQGLVVNTVSPEAERTRRVSVELLVANDRGECLTCAKNNSCGLQEVAAYIGITPERMARLRSPTEPPPVDTSNPFFDFDPGKCVLCGICVRTCDEIVGVHAIDYAFRGYDTTISVFANKPVIDSRCVSCGECVVRCPVGALVPKEHRQPTREVSTVCPYCGVGCGIYLGVRGNEVIASRGDPGNRSSQGQLCVKGRYGFGFVNHEDRLTTPLIRVDGELKPASWDEALDYVAERLVQYRGDSFASFCSAKTTNEDAYIQQKFARLLMQTNNVDHCARLCHAPSVLAMMTALGSGATSNSYVDFEQAGCLIVVGADPNSNHPVVAARIQRAVAGRGVKLIVINPRRVDLCDYADLWLRPRPGTDVALLNGLAKAILDEGLLDRDFVANRTEGFEEWAAVVHKYTLDHVEEVTGVSAEDICQAARMYANPPFVRGRDGSSLPPFDKGGSGGISGGSCLIWGMGITQHAAGTANAHGLLNLALVSGQIGKPGSGVSPLRGQNNVQGCGDAGCLPNTLPGYQAINDDNVAGFQAAWGGHPLPKERGLMLTEAVEAMPEGRIKAVFIMGENPLLSEPDLHHAEEAFRSLEFLVVQDLFLHETAQIADVVLPATSFAEKDGTFTNSERRVQRVRKAIQPPGQSRPDWEIVCDLGRRVSKRMGLRLEEQFTFDSPSQVWDEMARLIPFIEGISYGRLEEGGVQWPCPTPDHPGTRYLYAEGFPRGPRAKFVAFDQGKAAEEMPSKRYPFILNTGRVLYHWHGGTMTRRVAKLVARYPELPVAINPEDGRKHNLGDGQPVRITSRRGQLTGKALLTDGMRAGEIFIPFVKLEESAANFLTNSVYDPSSKIPEYKVCAVRLEAVE
jgi:predicted molibdopterin-dependent oxidoreductase YjgC